MKIIELRFKNLNSLYGEWHIDFSNPEYTSNGIFALTGPTGAGKSTILDAICLALYGSTPRLGKITKRNNEIMSRQTGECYAEVIFESQAGQFRCHWSQHRARTKASGNLTDSKHEISDVKNGTLLATKKALVAATVEEKTGMDFDRFTRSILLAQGGFDTFLKADDEQKSKILEQITGTEIYSFISVGVHERQRLEQEKLKNLKVATSSFAVMSQDKEATAMLELRERIKREDRLIGEITTTNRALLWLAKIADIQEEIDTLSSASVTLSIEKATFQAALQKLDLANKAAEFDGDFATLTAVRKQQHKEHQSLLIETAKIAELEAQFKHHFESHSRAEKQTQKARDELRSITPLLQQIRTLDQQLETHSKVLRTATTDCKKATAQIASVEKLNQVEQNKSAIATKKLQLVNEFSKANYPDAWLVGGLAGVEEQLRNRQEKHQEIAKLTENQTSSTASLKIITAKLQDLTKKRNTKKQELDVAVAQLELGNQELQTMLAGRELQEYQAEKEALLLKIAFLTHVAELQDQRAQLEDSQPCPLCGATEHPFAKGNIPVPDEMQEKSDNLFHLILDATEQEMAIKKLEAKEKTAQIKLVELEKLEATTASEHKAMGKILSTLTEYLNNAKAIFTALQNSVVAKLQPLGIKEIPDLYAHQLLDLLKDRQHNWLQQTTKKTELEQRIATQDSEIKGFNALIETLRKTLAEKQLILTTAQQEHQSMTLERHQLFADKNPAVEEDRLNKLTTTSEQKERQTRAEHFNSSQQLAATKTSIASWQQTVTTRITELETLELNFNDALLNAGFPDETSFQNSRIPGNERSLLKAKAKELESRQNDLKIRQNDRRTRLSIELSKKVTPLSRKEIDQQLAKLEQQRDELRQSGLRVKQKLAENHYTKKRLAKHLSIVEAQNQECLRWDKIHTLIGSADGKKYRNFAQGLTFELMVGYANIQLKKMSDRYLLIRDKDNPLELNVIDNYQACEHRSTRNLSGGESFIMSLTLALGLSKMSSRKVRVDSLFLDEGFGTLDEESLEIALETLASLHEEGKLIGVISHVSALKERISTQITVTPLFGGKSNMSGPGCSRISS